MSSSGNQNINKSISKISHIHSLSADFLTERLSEKGLENFASSHGNILFQLSLVDSMRMNELSEKINRDKSTTTVLVQKLINKGLVEVKSSETDKRSKLISLSEKGREYNKLTAEISSELIKTFYKGFTREEKETFFALLCRIEQNFIE